MKNNSNDPIQYFTDAVLRDKKLLKAQLKEVKEKYPLVAFAYQIQRAVIYELSMPRNVMDTSMSPLYQAVELFTSDSMAQIKVERQERLEKLKTCLQRAHTSDSSSGQQYMAGLDCFETFVKGDDREPVDD